MFCHHGFLVLSVARDVQIDSPKYTCLGDWWHLEIFLKGFGHAKEEYDSHLSLQ